MDSTKARIRGAIVSGAGAMTASVILRMMIYQESILVSLTNREILGTAVGVAVLTFLIDFLYEKYKDKYKNND